jgi:pantothenate kinase type III
MAQSKADLIIYSSVKRETEKVFLEIIEACKKRAIKADELVAKYSEIDFSKINGMGTDRKLGLIGALSYLPAPIITVDFGTCITLNILNKAHICQGGLILPGIFTQSRALHDYTSALPRIELFSPPKLYGQNTINAINSGIINIAVKGLNAQIRDIIRTEFPDERASVVFTGGASFVAEPFTMDFEAIFDKELVFKALKSLSSLI